MSNNQEKINEIRQTFSPKIRFGDLKKPAEKHSEIESSAFYELIEKLTSEWKPSVQDKYESKWGHFYLPIDREGVMICTAVNIFLSYKKIYYVTFTDFSRYGGAAVDKGTNEVPEDYALIFDEISRFTPFMKDYGNELAEELYPLLLAFGTHKAKIYSLYLRADFKRGRRKYSRSV
ncbi:hypothetical protein QUF80_09380 [Desulfococcaceae bacterium HSG8]|nr:hypothetical protein [Desulfococcaceae bacterium HSG8]